METVHLNGRVSAGQGIGRTLGFPTANLDCRPNHLAFGIYAGYATVHDRPITHVPALIYWGERPTFAGAELACEIYLIDRTVDLVSTTMSAELTHLIRPDQRFTDVSRLTAQMQRDVAAARRLLSDGSDGAGKPGELDPDTGCGQVPGRSPRGRRQ